ncbi:MAG: MerR family transcriptional regulator [Desulfobacterales bacterium]|nr:MerR family transcriptional regulator [Desulfobacterales bacterium]
MINSICGTKESVRFAGYHYYSNLKLYWAMKLMDSGNKREDTFLINEVSRRVGLSQKRIREYEKGGLVKPERELRSNNRRYSESEINQILRIKELIHEHGFTIACLKYFLSSAPCWIIFNCPEKETCPTYSNPRTPCYEMVKKAAVQNELKNCQSCPIYLNRNEQKMPLLAKP